MDAGGRATQEQLPRVGVRVPGSAVFKCAASPHKLIGFLCPYSPSPRRRPGSSLNRVRLCRSLVIPAYAYRDVGGRATQDAKAEAGIQSE